MKARILEKKENYLRFFISGFDVALANSLRRTMMTEVPVMAIDDVIIIENSSPIKDEVLAHRLGFLPLKTDNEAYVLPNQCTCNSELGCSNCSVTLTLDSDARDGSRSVYSKELKSSDPAIHPVHENIPIIKLAQGQNVRLEAYAKLGLGINHAKWQPTSSCTYKYASIIRINRRKCTKCTKCVDACPKHVLQMGGNTLRVINDDHCNLCRECENICPEDAIRVEWRKNSYIFNIESTGALAPETIFLTAIDILKEKAIEFTQQIEQLISGDEQ
jgi:DNA-directed RNA polymerase subunit D